MNLSKTYLSKIPIAIGRPDLRDNLVSYVDKVIAVKKENPSADTSDIESEIDNVSLWNI